MMMMMSAWRRKVLVRPLRKPVVMMVVAVVAEAVVVVAVLAELKVKPKPKPKDPAPVPVLVLRPVLLLPAFGIRERTVSEWWWL
uniref:Putative secreted peptide n=1 Tax=Anopheles braziliensis TaxID=58242 RepID=A0A2M3ZR65_9DIPT